MKYTHFTFLVLSLTTVLAGSALAVDLVPLNPCNARSMGYLRSEIAEAKKENMTVKLMKNRDQEVVGMYAYGTGPEDVRADVCGWTHDPLNDFDAASDWMYWDRDAGSPNPATWARGKVATVYQDEGYLYLRVLKRSSTGDVRVALSIEGTNGEDGSPRMVVEDVIEFSPLD